MCIVLNEYYNFYYYDLDLQSDQAIFAYGLVYWPDHRLAIIVAWTSSCVRVCVCVCVCGRATSTL